jgi:SAM-dependent methyltransferase
MITGKLATFNSDTVTEYYDQCWMPRFQQGHNPRSLAMHLGHFTTEGLTNDEAKLEANLYLADVLGLVGREKRTVLDAGCGVGGTVFHLAKSFPATRFIGVNISENQVQVAQQFCPAGIRNAGNVDFMVSDYVSMPLADRSVDAAYAVESLCHAVSKERVLSELHRVLIPGGLFLVMDYFVNLTPSSPQMQFELELFCGGWAVPGYHTRAHGFYTALGFDVVSDQDITDRVRPGIKRSEDVAIDSLGSEADSVADSMHGHLRACLALSRLVDAGVIGYRALMLRSN